MIQKFKIGRHELQSPALFASYRLGDHPASGLRRFPWKLTETEALLINAYDFTRPKYKKWLNDGWQPETYLEFDAGPLLIDSGAYYFLKHPEISITPQQVLQLEIQSRADAGVILDHPFPPDAPDKARRINTTLRNTKTMLKSLADHHNPTNMALWPVIHGHTPRAIQSCITRLQRLADQYHAPLLAHVGIGSLAPLAQRGQTVLAVEVIHQVRQLLPQSLIHCFSMGSALNMLLAFRSGANSVDSQTWIVSAGFKLAQLPGHYVVRMGRREYGDNCKFLESMKRFSDRLARLSDEEGFFTRDWMTGTRLNMAVACARRNYIHSLVDLHSNEHVHNRACHNLWSYNFEVRRYRQATHAGKLDLFLASRLQGTRYQAALERSMALRPAP